MESQFVFLYLNTIHHYFICFFFSQAKSSIQNVSMMLVWKHSIAYHWPRLWINSFCVFTVDSRLKFTRWKMCERYNTFQIPCLPLRYIEYPPLTIDNLLLITFTPLFSIYNTWLNACNRDEKEKQVWDHFIELENFS